VDPITAAYVQDDADWTITVSGLGKTLTARAPGIIAARDRADQLVEKLAPEQNGRTVVHLLNGSAFDFTAAYMQARLARPAAEEAKPEPAKPEAKKPARKPTATKPAAAKPAVAKPKRTKPAAKRTVKPAPDQVTTANGKAELNGVLPEAVTAEQPAANPS
jgi:hypothetical protein